MKKFFIRSGSVCLLLLMTLLFTACATQPTTGAGSGPIVPLSTSTPSTSTSSTVSENCPTAGQARAAYLQSIVQPKDQTIVYQYTQMGTNQTSLKYYDVTTHTKGDIYVAPAGETVADPMLSADGKWIVFVSYNANGGAGGGNEKVQVVGVNGRLLQTIYCTDSKHGIASIQWSPDLAHIVFSTSAYGSSNAQPDGDMYMLNTANGNLQKVPSGSAYEAIGWQDVTHLYVAKTKAGHVTGDKELDLLNITGAMTGVQTVFTNPHDGSWSSSLSPDGQHVYIDGRWLGNVHGVNGVGLTDIIAEPARGGQGKIISHTGSAVEDFQQICAATNQTLLMNINNSLYTMDTDGQNTTKIAGNNGSVQVGCMYSWQTVSRDSALYAYENSDTRSNKLYYGLLSHSGTQPMTIFADTGNETDTVQIVGWTVD